jgi:hypothetical protein
MGLSRTANDALRRQLAQAVHRIDDVQVALEPGTIEVDRDMARQDVARGQGSWKETTLRTAKRKRFLTAPYQCGAGDNCHATLRQRRTNDEWLDFEGRAQCRNHSIS